MSEFVTNLKKKSIFKKIGLWIWDNAFRISMATIFIVMIRLQAQAYSDFAKINTLIAEQNIEMYTVQTMQYVLQDKIILAVNDKVENLAVTATTLADAVDLTSRQRDDKINSELKRLSQKPDYEYLKSITLVMRAKSKDIDKHDGWMGTGVVIKITKDATYVVTNNHICTWDADHICYVEDSETKTEYPISLVKSNHFGRDIQIVKFDGVIPGKQAVKGVANASIQDSVYMVGHNNGNLFIYGEGIVAGWDDEKNLEVQISSTHGNSGSGIINKDGYLVGLIFAGQILHDFPYTIGDSSKAICVNSEVVRLMVAGIIE